MDRTCARSIRSRSASGSASFSRTPCSSAARSGRTSPTESRKRPVARAIIRDAPILILDEPLTGLDAASESLVLDALRTLMRGKTTVTIAHNLATVQHADVIFVLDHGRVCEQGTHASLLAVGGVYARLH